MVDKKQNNGDWIITIPALLVLALAIFLLIRERNQINQIQESEPAQVSETARSIPELSTDSVEPTIPANIARPVEPPKCPACLTFNEVAKTVGCPNVQAEAGTSVQGSLEQLLECLKKK